MKTKNVYIKKNVYILDLHCAYDYQLPFYKRFTIEKQTMLPGGII